MDKAFENQIILADVTEDVLPPSNITPFKGDLKVLYEDDIKESGFLDKSILSNYASAGYHKMYICEIINAYQKA